VRALLGNSGRRRGQLTANQRVRQYSGLRSAMPGSQLLIVTPPVYKMVGDVKHGMSDSYNGLFISSSDNQAATLCRQIGVFGA
jgi:hypothetical protein